MYVGIRDSHWEGIGTHIRLNVPLSNYWIWATAQIYESFEAKSRISAAERV